MTSVDHQLVGLEGPGGSLVIVGVVFAAVSVLTVSGRLLSRFTVARILGYDDLIMVGSLVGCPAILYSRRTLILWWMS